MTYNFLNVYIKNDKCLKDFIKVIPESVLVCFPNWKRTSPLAEYLMIRELQYPSDTKNSPVLKTATPVGLQKCVASLPG